jgi:hypothetical protein
MSAAHLDVERFWRNGYAIIRDVFGAAEIGEMRRRADETIAAFGRPGAEIDVLAAPLMRGVLLDDRILALAGAILGETPIYFGESNFGFLPRVDRVGSYHKDNTDRLDPSGPDWRGRYNVIKFAIYLQDHRGRAGGLTVLRRSNHGVRRNRIAEVLTEEIVSPLAMRAHYLQTRLGDVVAWPLTTTHAGLGNALRFAPFLTVTERNQRFVPSFLAYGPCVKPRGAVFLSFAGEGPHFERYIAHEKTRKTQVKRWSLNAYDSDALAALAGKPVRLRDMNREIADDIARGAAVGQTAKWTGATV